MAIGIILCVETTACPIFVETRYEKKVQKDKESTLLSPQEQKGMEEYFGDNSQNKLNFTKKHKNNLIIFGITSSGIFGYDCFFNSMGRIWFVIGSFVLYLLLSFLITSTSGLAYVSIPIMGALAKEVGLSPEVMEMIFVSGYGLINTIIPTSGVVMGGLEICHVNYSTWIKFITKPLWNCM